MTHTDKKKAILIIADGLGGRPTDVDGRTCLEAARTPQLDALTERGEIGLVDPIGPGIRPGSDTAHLSLLGYDPHRVYTGRGVFECLGAGLAVAERDVCFRANLATVEDEEGALRLVDRRAGRIETGQGALAEAINGIRLTGDVAFEFRATTQHRGALRLRATGLSSRIGETDPHEIGALVPACAVLDEQDEGARRTAAAIDELTRLSHEALRDLPINRQRIEAGELPANVLLVRGASIRPRIETIESIYGVRGAVISGGALYRGVGLAVGMQPIDVPGATGGLDTDLAAKAGAALKALETLDYVFLHVKGTDNAGHDGDASAKAAFIERIDRELIGPLVERLDWRRTHLAFTGDHTTPPGFGDHTAEPVPVLMVGPDVRCDASTAFGEREAAAGGLSRFSGMVLPTLFNYNNWNPKFGS